MPRPEVVVFDVNETLSDTTPMTRRFVEIGAAEGDFRLWFASLLRDGFALTAAGATESFRTIAEGSLRSVLSGRSLDRDLSSSVEHILAGFTQLGVHTDVVDSVVALRQQGLRLITLSNGATDVADRLLTAAGIREHFEQLLSVEAVGVWKPAPGAYGYASDACGVAAGQLLLVAVHPWDIDGAARAGLRTAWINRAGAPFPGYFAPPDHAVASLGELPGRLAG